MSAPAASFLDDAAAPLLFSPEDLPAKGLDKLVELEGRGEYTAHRLFSQRRNVYEIVVRMLGANLPVQLIADLCGVSGPTVRRVRELEPVAINEFRERMGVRRRNMIAMCADVISAKLEAGDVKSLAAAQNVAVVMNILDQQDRLDSGAPTQRIEITGVPAAEEFRRFLASKVMDDAIEVAATGLTGGAAATKAAAVASPTAPGSPASDHPLNT